MKKILIIIPVFLLILAASYFLLKPDEPTPEDQVAALASKYMNFTLGSLSGSEVDYDEAREILAPNLRSQFTDPAFVPESYCIQDGPEKVRVESVERSKETGGWEVLVEAEYGGEWQEMWEFKVVSAEGGSWMISEITCLHELGGPAAPGEVVRDFMFSTLGTLSGSNIDYERAENLMTSSYSEEFTSPAFIPNAYGIQEGPTEIEFEGEDVMGEEAEVIVMGYWGEDLQMRWKFELEQEEKEWKINFINPGQ